jgi:hypothetical protein
MFFPTLHELFMKSAHFIIESMRAACPDAVWAINLIAALSALATLLDLFIVSMYILCVVRQRVRHVKKGY